MNPLTGKQERRHYWNHEIYLSKADDQIGRIKTLLSGALRNRAAISISNQCPTV
jgi:hypothetical protein